MKRRWFRWWWAILLVPMAVGFARLHFDADVLDLLPPTIAAVQGLKLYQGHFGNARELIITVQGTDADSVKSSTQAIAAKLRRETNLVADATWQPPWLEHPEQMAELLAYLWLNQPPEVFNHLAESLAPTNLTNVLEATKDRLAVTLSPADLAVHGTFSFLVQIRVASALPRWPFARRGLTPWRRNRRLSPAAFWSRPRSSCSFCG